MAQVVLVGIITLAAETYAKQFATTVGLSAAEALFNQARIAADLDKIKAELSALSKFIRTQLPLLISQVVEVEFARSKESEIVEKAQTIKERIGTLQQARRDGATDERIGDIVSELVGHVDAILEMGGFLALKGQPYYASVSVALCSALKGYAALITEQPWRDGELRALAQRWKARIEPWQNPAIPTSFAGILPQLESRKSLSDVVLPTVQTWKTHVERRFAISWGSVMFVPGVFVYGGWYGVAQDGKADGNRIGQALPAGMTFEEAVGNGTLTMTIPEWWTVKANTPPSVADYDEAIGIVANLVTDYDALTARIATVNSALTLIRTGIQQLDKILDNTVTATIPDIVAAANIVTVG